LSSWNFYGVTLLSKNIFRWAWVSSIACSAYNWLSSNSNNLLVLLLINVVLLWEMSLLHTQWAMLIPPHMQDEKRWNQCTTWTWNYPPTMSQPHFEGSVRSPLTLPKMGLGSPPGLLKIQNSIAGVKTPRLEMFFISLERSWSVNVQNILAWATWTYTTQVMVERKAGSQTDSSLPTTKSQESTRPWCVKVKCDTPLKSSWRKLQIWFRPWFNWRLEREVMNAQSPGSQNQDNFETPLWESREKVSFGCGCGWEA
jgi:hypothetical protein